MYNELMENTRKTVINTLLWTMLVFFPLLCYPQGGIFGVLKAKYYGLLFLSFFMLLLLVEKRRIEREEFFLFGFLAMALLSSLLAEHPKLALLGNIHRYDGMITLLAYAVVYLFFSRYGKVEDRLLYAMLDSGMLVCVLGFMQFFSLGEVYFVPFSGRAFGLMGNPNFYGSFLSLLLPLSLYVFLEKDWRSGALFFLVFFLALLTSMARSAWIGSSIGLLSFVLFYDWKKNREKRKRLLLLGLCLAVISTGIMAIHPQTKQRVESIFREGINLFTSSDHSGLGAGRLDIWKKSFILIGENPLLGVGPEHMLFALNQEVEEIKLDKAHNEYVDRAVATGVPSLILYLAWIFTILRRAWKKRGNPLVLALMCAVFSYLLQAFFNIAIVMVYPYFMAILGILSYSSKRDAFSLEKSLKGYR